MTVTSEPQAGDRVPCLCRRDRVAKLCAREALLRCDRSCWLPIGPKAPFSAPQAHKSFEKPHFTW